MTAVFADTFYWVALTDPGDALYEQAAQIGEVLSEFLTFFFTQQLAHTTARS